MDRFQIKNPQVIHETLDGEVVIVNLETGTYYCLTGTGERIWAALARGATLDGILAEIRAAYEGVDGHLEETVGSFVDELEREALIARSHGRDEESPPHGLPAVAAGAGATFKPPVLEKFQDLKELILLDPVHEIHEDLGWPHPKTAR